MEKIKVPERVMQRAANAGPQTPAMAGLPASVNLLTPVAPQTRGQWYAVKNGGGIRTARKQFTCQQFGCFKKVEPGEHYFDTMETTTWPATKRICCACSEETI